MGPRGEDDQQARVVVSAQRGAGGLAAGGCCIGEGGVADACPAAAAGARKP
jgi:hypothetical protein